MLSTRTSSIVSHWTDDDDDNKEHILSNHHLHLNFLSRPHQHYTTELQRVTSVKIYNGSAVPDYTTLRKVTV